MIGCNPLILYVSDTNSKNTMWSYYYSFFDIGLTNAWVYYKMCHKETCSKEEARVDFFQAIAECMVNSNTNWHEYEQSSTAASNLLRDSEVQEGETHDSTCRPVHLNNLPCKLSTKIKLCQVCKYELRKQQWKSVTLCPKHGVWLCTEVCHKREELVCLPLQREMDQQWWIGVGRVILWTVIGTSSILLQGTRTVQQKALLCILR